MMERASKLEEEIESLLKTSRANWTRSKGRASSVACLKIASCLEARASFSETSRFYFKASDFRTRIISNLTNFESLY